MIRAIDTRVFALFLTAAALSGCLTSGESDDPSSSPGNPPGGNSPPTISGAPGNAAMIGNSYSFTPTASDPDGDSLTFTIENRPSWATFDAGNGTLAGIPTMGDEGTYSNIVVSVSDGQARVSLPAFTLNVSQSATGSATLSWTPPTENMDGTALTDLAGYKIYYGLSQGNYPNVVQIDNPGISTFVVENLGPNTYFFVTTAFNTNGLESNYSNVTSKTIN